MIELDGAEGEGGGQILRSALSLSVLTGRKVRIRNIRAGPPRPGLLRQHLCCVQAAARVGSARVEGAELGSRDLTFEPGPVLPGVHEFKINSAGSTTLVLQTVLPPLLAATGPSTVLVEGGTHNPSAPPANFLANSFARCLAQMGVLVNLHVERPGLYPSGGGRIVMRLAGNGVLAPLALLERGPVQRIRATILVATVPRSVAAREARVLTDRLGIPSPDIDIVDLGGSTGPGNVVLVEVECAETTATFMALGARGKPAEAVAKEVCDDAHAWMSANVPVDQHLADQLLLPLAMGRGGEFRTTTPSLHTTTNATVIERFLGTRTELTDEGDGRFRVRMAAPAASA